MSLKDYEKIKILGKGAHGRVYLVRDKRNNKKYALKLVNAEELNPAFIESLKKECSTLSKVDHPNALRCYEFGMQRHLLYSVIDYIPGQDLIEIIEEVGLPFSYGIAVDIGISIAKVLVRLDELNLVHRDVKPDNIVIDPASTDGFARLIDFGLAFDLEKDTLPKGSVSGTPLYLDPDYFNRSNLTTKSDVYSLGVVLYMLLAGHNPFDSDEGPIRVMVKHTIVKPKSIPNIPPKLNDLILKMLAKTSDERPTAQEVLIKLQKIKEKLKYGR